jgi:SNF family Na+-dependent transporter
MMALFSSAVDICLLRRAPQDLPVSRHLLWLLILLNLLIGIVVVLDNRTGLLRAVLESVAGLVLMLGALAAALSVKGRLPRFNQTASATLLSGLLLSILAWPLVAWRHRHESMESELLLLLLFAWSIAVLGHILRHAFEVSLNLGIAFALLYTLLAWSIMSHLFPVAT